MKRQFFSIIFPFVFLMAGTELHQILHIPFVVGHYRHHKDEKPSLTFLEFLKLHYSVNHPDDQDDSDDSKLPFKSSADINHLDLAVIAFKGTDITHETGLTELRTEHRNNNLPQISFSIFHPPRFVY